jgi:hypothetical protein
MIIVDRVTVQADLYPYGYDEDNMLIVSQTNAFMTTILFHKWVEEVFLSTIEAKRMQKNYQDLSVLIMEAFIAFLCLPSSVLLSFLVLFLFLADGCFHPCRSNASVDPE